MPPHVKSSSLDQIYLWVILGQAEDMPKLIIFDEMAEIMHFSTVMGAEIILAHTAISFLFCTTDLEGFFG